MLLLTEKSEPITETPVLTGKAKRLANLRPWKKGDVPNPGGRPKTADLREIVLKDFKKDPAGNVLLLKKERIDLFFAYGFGKPIEQIELNASVQHSIDPELIRAAQAAAQAIRQKPI